MQAVKSAAGEEVEATGEFLGILLGNFQNNSFYHTRPGEAEVYLQPIRGLLFFLTQSYVQSVIAV